MCGAKRVREDWGLLEAGVSTQLAGSGVCGRKGEDGGRGARQLWSPRKLLGVLGALTGTLSAPHLDPDPELPAGQAKSLCRVKGFLEAGRAVA